MTTRSRCRRRLHRSPIPFIQPYLWRSKACPWAAGEDLSTIYVLLRRHTGHDFSQYKETTIYRRLYRRMQALQLATVPTYIERLRHDPHEREFLFKDLLIGVTHFFRDPEAFAALAHAVIP